MKAPISAEDQVKYLMSVLKHTELPQPDYHAVAKENGISDANTAQKKFKAIIESAGYALSNRQVIDPNAAPIPPSDPTAPSTPVKSRAKKSSPAKSTPKATKTPKTPKTAKAPRSANKKRKVDEMTDDSDAGENGGVYDSENVKQEEQENGDNDKQTVQDEDEI